MCPSLGYDLAWAYTDFAYAVSTVVTSYLQMYHYIQKVCLLAVSHFIRLIYTFYALSSAVTSEVEMRVDLCSLHDWAFRNLSFSAPWLLVCHHVSHQLLKVKVLILKMRDALIYGYNDIHHEHLAA